MGFSREILYKIPHPLRQGIKFAYGKTIPAPLRYGKVFRETYDFLMDSQWWSRSKFEAYQMEQLEKLLKHAYENVPYYHRVFKGRGLKPRDIKSIDDLKKLPYLTKDIIRENLDDLIARNYQKSKLHAVSTGGSTGEPLQLYWEKGLTDEKERAFLWRQWNWAGIKFRDKKVVLRGCNIRKLRGHENRWWAYDPIENALLLSSYELTQQNLPKYVNKIEEFQPYVIQAYPSSLAVLCTFLKHNNKKLESVRTVLTCSETLFPWQRKLIEETMGANVFDHYGSVERCMIAAQCEKVNGYHIFPEYGITELVDRNGGSVNEEGEIVEFFVTGFNNYAMPLIRFRIGDIGAYTKKECLCGRKTPMLEKVEGRLQDYLVDNEDNVIPLTGVTEGAIFKFTDNVEKSQLLQRRKGEVIVRIEKAANYTHRDEEHILNTFRNRFGDSFSFSVEYLPDIGRTGTGKYKYLVQELPVSSFFDHKGCNI